MLGIFWRRATAPAALLTLVLGSIVCLGIGIADFNNADFLLNEDGVKILPHFLLLSFYLFCGLIVLMVAASLATTHSPEETELPTWGAIHREHPGLGWWGMIGWGGLAVVMVAACTCSSSSSCNPGQRHGPSSEAAMRGASAFLACICVIALCVATHCVMAGEIWVAPDGNDRNPGTRDEPLHSPAAALRKGREMRRLHDPAADDGVHIILRGGVYRMTTPLVIRPEDSGTEDSPTVLQAAPGEQPVLSGGVEVSGWRLPEAEVPGLPTEAAGHVWVADVPVFHGRELEFRQLWVNNKKATRARRPNAGEMARLTHWDRKAEVAGIPASLAGPYADAGSLEMVLQQAWAIANLRIKSLTVEGDNALVTFHDPESRVEFEHPWPQPTMHADGAPFFLTGAIEMLDQPGEWHLDRRAGRVYYWPREGEDMTGDHVVVPALDTLVEIAGTLDRPVGHVSLSGIGFQHTTWLRPSRQGHVPLQATMYMTEAYGLRPAGTPDWRSLDNQAWLGRPPAAVAVRGAHHTRIVGCRFEHLGSTGLDLVRGTHDDLIEGNVFRDIGGNGIQVGNFSDGPIEAHLPFNPADEREVCTRERITNNLVTNCGSDDWGAVGIVAGFVREVAIEHNEVSHLPYMGITVGWGWTRTANAMRDNRVADNHIHHIAQRMADDAAIYTLSAQPGTVIERNHIHSIRMSPYVHDPEHWFYLYLDEGSTRITVRNNWCPAQRFLANANGPGNVWENNGPQVSDDVKQSAGLEQEYRHLLDTVQNTAE